jgi:hypothetical protein
MPPEIPNKNNLTPSFGSQPRIANEAGKIEKLLLEGKHKQASERLEYCYNLLAKNYNEEVELALDLLMLKLVKAVARIQLSDVRIN